MLTISILVNDRSVLVPTENSVKDNNDMPGHLARRFQQIAVAVFLAEVEGAGFDLTPVQYAALATIKANPGLDQVTLAGLIAYDRTTITGVIDRLVQKGLAERRASSRDRRARESRDHRRGPAHAAEDHAISGIGAAHHAAWPQREGERGVDAAATQGDCRRQRSEPRAAARHSGMKRYLCP